MTASTGDIDIESIYLDAQMQLTLGLLNYPDFTESAVNNVAAMDEATARILCVVFLGACVETLVGVSDGDPRAALSGLLAEGIRTGMNVDADPKPVPRKRAPQKRAPAAKAAVPARRKPGTKPAPGVKPTTRKRKS